MTTCRSKFKVVRRKCGWSARKALQRRSIASRFTLEWCPRRSSREPRAERSQMRSAAIRRSARTSRREPSPCSVAINRTVGGGRESCSRVGVGGAEQSSHRTTKVLESAMLPTSPHGCLTAPETAEVARCRRRLGPIEARCAGRPANAAHNEDPSAVTLKAGGFPMVTIAWATVPKGTTSRSRSTPRCSEGLRGRRFNNALAGVVP